MAKTPGGFRRNAGRAMRAVAVVFLVAYGLHGGDGAIPPRELLGEAANTASAATARAGRMRAMFGVAEAMRDAQETDEARRVWAQMRLRSSIESIVQALVESSEARSYGDELGALKRLDDFLWRSNERADLEIVLRLRRRAVEQIADPKARKQEEGGLATAQVSYQNAGKPLPLFPRERPKPPHYGGIPFPISVDGFRPLPRAERERRQKNDAVYLEQLYGFVKQRDMDAALQYAAQGSPDTEKAFGYATLEHLFLQAGDLYRAEGSADLIPDDHEDCALWRAEALTALARFYAAPGSNNRGLALFQMARELVTAVHPDLQYGRALVMNEIAEAESDAGYAGASQQDFPVAVKMATEIPKVAAPDSLGGPASPFSVVRRQDEAFGKIMASRIKAKDVSGAGAAADAWEKARGEGAYQNIADAWLAVGLNGDAVQWARARSSDEKRAEALAAAVEVTIRYKAD